jgi:hypothetical protein
MLVAVAVGSLLLPQLAAAAPTNQIEDVQLRPSNGRVDVVLKTSAPPTFQSFAKRSPPVVIVDVIDAAAVERTLKAPANSPIESVSLAPKKGSSGDVARLTLRLSSAVTYDVTATGKAVTVSIFGDAPATPAAQQAKVDLKGNSGTKVASLDRRDSVSDAPHSRLAQDEGAAGMSTGDSGSQRAMTYVGFRDKNSGSEVFARMNGSATFEVKREGPNLLVLEIKNATIPLMNNKNHLDATFFEGSPVKMITPTEVEDATPTIRIIIEMKEDVPYRQEVRGKEITVIFQKS